jgi:hypothetical protein
MHAESFSVDVSAAHGMHILVMKIMMRTITILLQLNVNGLACVHGSLRIH